MKVFWHPIQQRHSPKFFLQRGKLRQNFEVPARAEALLAAVKSMGLDVVEPAQVERAVLETVHAPDYLSFLERAAADWAALPDHGEELVANTHPTPEMLAGGARKSATIVGELGWYTADTACPIGPGTWPAAEAAAAGAIAAAEEAAAGRVAYALARPPGHHSYAARAAGHCYLNNAALAAQHLLDRGAGRVAVLDIDSHHGNGTQGILWRRGDVFFASIHADPNRYYPWYVGHADEIGAGDGEGFNLNQPLAFGSGDEAWLAAIGRALAAVDRVGVDALVVSLGFDASKDEPLAALMVTEDGFAKAGVRIAALRKPTAIIQEGGYAVSVIGGLLTRFLASFAG
ncbi:MAG: histone deacetylase family protein [Hyphomicrobiales bacterium]